MHRAEFGDLQRQVAVALQPVLEDLHVARAVHRLQREDALVLGRRDEHVLAIGLPVARRLPQAAVEDHRGVDLDVAGRLLAPAHVADQRLEQVPALGVPEDRARPLLLEVEQVHLAAEAPVVALGGLLQALQVGVEVVLLGEGRAVDARQHRVVRVAAPIGARHLHQLEGRADLAGRRHVGPAAQVDPVALPVHLQRLVGRDGVDELDLEALAALREEALRVVAAPFLLGEGPVPRDDLAHALLDRREIVGREGRLAAGSRSRSRPRSPGRSSPACRGRGPARPRPARGRRRGGSGSGRGGRRGRGTRSARRPRSGPRGRPRRRRGPAPRCAWRARARWTVRRRGRSCRPGRGAWRRRGRSVRSRPCSSGLSRRNGPA